MALLNRKKKFDFMQDDGSVVNKNIIGCAYEVGTSVSVIIGSGNNIISGSGSNTIVEGWSFPNLGFGANWLPYFYNQNGSYNVGLTLIRGLSFSGLGNLASSYAERIITKVQQGWTGFEQSCKINTYASIKQGMWGSNVGKTFAVPFIGVSCTRNEAPTGTPPLRKVTLDVSIQIGKYTFNNYIWTGEDATVNIINIHVEGEFLHDAFRSAMQKLFANARNLYVAPMPYYSYNILSGPAIRYNNPNVAVDAVCILRQGDDFLADAGVGFQVLNCMQLGITTAQWTIGTEPIDPTDPSIEPDPYDPIPTPPLPPGPGPDPVPGDDPIPIPGYPPIDGTAIGLYRAFCPSGSQLRQIASQLWDPSVWSAIKQMFENPMEAILGLAIVPVNPTLGGSTNVYLGRYNTQVSVPLVASDYVTVDCGSIAIKKFYGSYLDHDPYTKYTIYLPYIGEMELNADEITGRVMNVVYHCNVITGDIVALIALDGRVCYTGMGNFIRQLPLSQTDYSSIIQTAVSAASVLLTTAVAGAGGSAVAGAAGAGSIAEVRAQARVASTVANGSSSLLSDVINTKYNYKHSGKIGQGAGQIGVQKPFLTINRPNLALPENNNLSQQSNLKAYTGYPCNKIVQLSSCHGFTQIEACKLSVPSATDEEIAEIYSLLKGGVLL